MYIAINLPQKTNHINKPYTNNLVERHNNSHLGLIQQKQILLPKPDWKENNNGVTLNMIDIYITN